MPIRPLCFSASVVSVALALSAISPLTQAVAQPADSSKTIIEAKGRLPLNDLRAFTEVLQRIKSAYIEPIDDKTLLENAIRGMLDNLDPHSAYLEQEDFKSLEESTSGEFGGIGIEISADDGLIKIITPIDNSPAKKAGIKAGDIIIKLDDTPLRGLGIKRSVDLMRGKIGEPIKITVIRAGIPQPLDITVIRNTIRVDSVRSYMLDKNLGYIRITQFQEDTGAEVEKTLQNMNRQGRLGGIILDLRNNPGGVFHASIDVADLFLDSGLIVYTKGRLANTNVNYRANAEKTFTNIPVVVLINSGSASASEIVAGALQDHRRGVVVGTKSFGKGSVQTVYPLSTDSKRGLKLTTALYYTPNGRSIQAEGITPDITVEELNVTKVQGQTGYREQNLKNHLVQNKRSPQLIENKNGQDNTSNSGKDIDYQLEQATNILKTLYLTKQQLPTGLSNHQHKSASAGAQLRY